MVLPGISRKTSDHFLPSRITKYANGLSDLFFFVVLPIEARTKSVFVRQFTSNNLPGYCLYFLILHQIASSVALWCDGPAAPDKTSSLPSLPRPPISYPLGYVHFQCDRKHSAICTVQAVSDRYQVGGEHLATFYNIRGRITF